MDDKEHVQSIVNLVRQQLKAEIECGYPQEQLQPYIDAVREFRAAIEGDDKWKLARVMLTIGRCMGQYDAVAANKNLIDAAERATNPSPWTTGERYKAVEYYWSLIGQEYSSEKAEKLVGQQFRKNGKRPSGRTIRNWRDEFSK